MIIVCFVSGSGTNYEKIVQRDPDHDYLVFTNRPGCAGANKASANGHIVIELSHVPYLQTARQKYGGGSIPRNCPERVKYEQDVWRLIEDKTGRAPDLICMAGYDQWLTDWTVDRYYPKIVNIHPGDTTKGYSGLHWIPAAKAILAGEKAIRSTLFFVDKGEDSGPVLAQSRPLEIMPALRAMETEGEAKLAAVLEEITLFSRQHSIFTYDDFEKAASAEQKADMKRICGSLQDALKVAGDWELYPFAVHSLLVRGRVKVVDRVVYVDDEPMPNHGYRMDREPLPSGNR